MPSRNSVKRAAKRVDHSGRLRRLKGVAIGLSAVLSMAFWWLVTGTIATAQTTPAQTTDPFATQQLNDSGSFFGGSSGSSLGGASSFQRPMLRSGGS